MQVNQKNRNHRFWNGSSSLSLQPHRHGLRLCWSVAEDQAVTQFLIYRNGRRVRTVSGQSTWCDVKWDGTYSVEARLETGETARFPSTLKVNLTDGYYFENVRYFYKNKPVTVLQAGKVDVSVRVGSLAPNPLSAVLVGAVYQNGRLTGCESTSKSVDGAMKELRLTLEIENPSNTVVQVYLWNGMKPDSPILEASVLA